MIQFQTKLITVNDWLILHLPEDASRQLSSRGQVMVKGTVNNIEIAQPLEPDGVGSHWFRVSDELSKKINAKSGDTVNVLIEQTKEWTEPEIPSDLKDAVENDPKAKKLWGEITPLARHDWIRWVRAAKTDETRKKHIEVSLSKMNKGMRRPCCFNTMACTEPHVANSKWQLDIK